MYKLQESGMHRSLIVVLSLASLASGALSGAASAATVEMAPGELKAYCDKKGGHYMDSGDGTTSCQIGFGKSAVVIGCGSGGKCTINHTMVFSSNSSKHRPVDNQAPNTTLGNGGKKPVAGNTSGASSTALKTPAGKDNKATNTRNDRSVLNGQSYVQSGRPGLQRQ
jgi:hypothetical protein